VVREGLPADRRWVNRLEPVLRSRGRGMEFRILGPLEVRDGDREVQLRGGKEQALLALLLLHANRTLALDRIVDDLWGADVPETAQKMVRVYVSRLRKLLPPGTISTRPPGYALVLEPEQLDLNRFETAVAEGRAALDAGRARQAADAYGEALSLWRGPALAEFASEPFAQPEGARLEDLRLYALEGRLEADLALGRHGTAVGELEALTAQHPLRERLRSQHMLALYRSGRHAEALASYQAFRRKLSEDLAIEPPASLRELERLMLQQDASLELAARDGAWAAAPVPATATPGDGASGQISYARSGDARIAYQVVGDGDLDLVLVHGWVCTFQPGWEYPKLAAFYRRLASMGRLILFDKRGTGLSDRVSPERLPDLETRMDDVRAVLDAVGSSRAVILGFSEGGSMSTLFAATHPERTLALVLVGTFPRMMYASDYPIGHTEDVYRRRFAGLDEDDWASTVTKEWLGRVAPDLLSDEAAVRWYVSYVMRGASPGAVAALWRMNQQIDIRDVLPTIAVPTLVAFRSEEYFGERTRFMGERVPGARVVELPGNDHLPWEGDREALLDEVERFLSGVRTDVEPDRVLATLLFTDIVGSTAKAVELGDRAWRDLLAEHDRLVRAQVARFRGREVDMAGDGIFATFDGPARAVRCAAAIEDALQSLGLEARAGVHTGEIEQTNGGVRGIAVHIAARIAASAGAGEVLVSGTVKDLVAGSGLAFEERGEQELDGVPGTWRLFSARF
jgi:DNA-binding SARP family transcriptional activator/pimeloyl-ACP methyl ester carboxylesterase/plasmid stabilization system protein ParE